jgi:hypothetical protein
MTPLPVFISLFDSRTIKGALRFNYSIYIPASFAGDLWDNQDYLLDVDVEFQDGTQLTCGGFLAPQPNGDFALVLDKLPGWSLKRVKGVCGVAGTFQVETATPEQRMSAIRFADAQVSLALLGTQQA